MTQADFFGNAKWVGASDRSTTSFSVLRGHFHAQNANTVTLSVLGLGFFKCYINGQCINPDTFLPLSSDFEGTADPAGEVLSGHRIYVPQFDITPFVKEGDNVIAIHYGGGWYTYEKRVFGLPKAIYQITVRSNNEMTCYGSDERCRIGKSPIESYHFIYHEHQSYPLFEDCLGADFDDSTWQHTVLTEAPQTEYCETDCPTDKLIKELPVKKIGAGERGTVYDVGENTTGYPVLKVEASKDEVVEVLFSESLLPDGTLDLTHGYGQHFKVICADKTHTVTPLFTWFGFRYFEVIGNAVPTSVKVIHADVKVNSSFHSDNETLNWMYRAFVNSMLTNLHTGHPCDCPHNERRGYTGDGQLTCNAALFTLNAKALYEKWLQDIADGQDTLSGRIQHTAPHIESGGGPGGWSCAIVDVPYQLYRHFGDKDILLKYYPNMLRYVDFLEAHTEFGLVTSNKEGRWFCLGEWCGPNIIHRGKEVVLHKQQVLLPPPLVNTYFAVKSLRMLSEIAKIIGKNEDVAKLAEKAELHARALKAAYFSTYDENVMLNVQGANAFFADLGLGTEKTYLNMVDYYDRLGYFDTGIFATDILTRVLFEHGDGALAVKLLKNDEGFGFERWRKMGATTFLEYWDPERCRSYNHPMFGAVVAYFFEHLLGIRQKDGTVGYTSVEIEPQATACFGAMSGSITSPQGKIAVAYKRADTHIQFDITVPKDTKAILHYAGKEYPLTSGSNHLDIAPL